MRLWAVLMVVPVQLWAGPQLAVSIFDGDPYDRVRIEQRGDCRGVTGRLTVDFSTSKGDVVLDTLRGGPGTKDPMEIRVEAGPLQVEPVADGAQVLRISMFELPPGVVASVTMDFDDQKGWWPGPRIVADGEDLEGTRLRFETKGFGAETTLPARGEALIDLPEDACNSAPESAPFSSVPMG